MAPIVVQAVSGAPTFSLELSAAETTVGDLKVRIAELGVQMARQRLVARGRILLDDETLGSVGLASGGRVFLAILPERPLEENEVGAAHVGEPPNAAVPDTTPDRDAVMLESSEAPRGFEVVVRAVDGEGEARVFTLSSSSVAAFKREVLTRLGTTIESEADLHGYSFVYDGKLIQDDADSVADCGLGPDARIVVVPPHVRAAMRQPQRLSCRQLPGACLRRSRRVIAAIASFPVAFLAWLTVTWEDPWSLVRPNVAVEDRPGGRRHHMFRVNPRVVRYGPGQNPHGEDLTALLTQALLGGGG